MAKFLVESPHTKEECLEALDELKDENPKLLDKMEFGCMSGEHTGWATVEAGSESEVRQMIPKVVREKAHIVEVNKITPEQIESFHQSM